jgi:hypothetical protein
MIQDMVLNSSGQALYIPIGTCSNLKIGDAARSKNVGRLRALMLDVPSAQVLVISNKGNSLRAIRQEMVHLIDAIDKKIEMMECMAKDYQRMKTMTEEEWLLAKQKARNIVSGSDESLSKT